MDSLFFNYVIVPSTFVLILVWLIMLAARPNKLVKIGVWLNVIACGLSVLGCMIDAQILQQGLLIISVAFLFSGAVICLIGIVYPPECWKRRKQSEEKEVGTNQ